MDRFGSSRLRIVWSLACLLLAGLALGSIQGFDPEGTQLVIFRTAIPIGSDAPGLTLASLAGFITTLVPAILVLGGFLALGDWLAANSRAERFKGLFLGSALAFVHGLFLSQMALLPVLAVSFKFFGNPLDQAGMVDSWNRIFQADLHAVILGLQLLLWTGALGLVLRSNYGLAVLGAYALASIGKLLTWIGAGGADLELPRWIVRSNVFLGHALPTETLPSDALAWSALPLAIGSPLVLAALLLLFPARTGKSSAKKAKA